MVIFSVPGVFLFSFNFSNLWRVSGFIALRWVEWFEKNPLFTCGILLQLLDYHSYVIKNLNEMSDLIFCLLESYCFMVYFLNNVVFSFSHSFTFSNPLSLSGFISLPWLKKIVFFYDLKIVFFLCLLQWTVFLEYFLACHFIYLYGMYFNFSHLFLQYF